MPRHRIFLSLSEQKNFIQFSQGVVTPYLHDGTVPAYPLPSFPTARLPTLFAPGAHSMGGSQSPVPDRQGAVPGHPSRPTAALPTTILPRLKSGTGGRRRLGGPEQRVRRSDGDWPAGSLAPGRAAGPRPGPPVRRRPGSPARPGPPGPGPRRSLSRSSRNPPRFARPGG